MGYHFRAIILTSGIRARFKEKIHEEVRWACSTPRKVAQAVRGGTWRKVEHGGDRRLMAAHMGTHMAAYWTKMRSVDHQNQSPDWPGRRPGFGPTDLDLPLFISILDANGGSRRPGLQLMAEDPWFPSINSRGRLQMAHNSLQLSSLLELEVLP